MKPSLYIETTIPSFLTGKRSINLILAGKQEVTHQWWQERKHHYDLHISQFVLDEASQGDPEAAQKRLQVLADIKMLEVDDASLKLTKRILDSRVIPTKSATDAAHIAIASRYGIEFLMTWNCTHIANAEILSRINYIVSEAGYFLPTICTPDELFGGHEND